MDPITRSIRELQARADRLRDGINEIEQDIAALERVRQRALLKARVSSRDTVAPESTPPPAERGGLKNGVEHAVRQLSHDFTPADVRAVLEGVNPRVLHGISRTAVAKTLSRLAKAGELIQIVEVGKGKKPARYRRL